MNGDAAGAQGTGSSRPGSPDGAIQGPAKHREAPTSKLAIPDIAASESLIELIAKDVVSSFVKEKARSILSQSEDDFDDDSILFPTNSSSSGLNLDAIAEKVVQSLQAEHAIYGSTVDRPLRELLRKSLLLDDEQDNGTAVTGTATFSASTTFTGESPGCSPAGAGDTTEAANPAEPMTWDPDFLYSNQECNNTLPSQPSKLPESAEPVPSDKIVQQSHQLRTKKGRSRSDDNASLYEFLKSQGYEISSSDSDDNFDENNASILSDITGLTEVFPLSSKAKHPKAMHPQNKKKEARRRADFALAPTPSGNEGANSHPETSKLLEGRERFHRKSNETPPTSPSKATLLAKSLSTHSETMPRSSNATDKGTGAAHSDAERRLIHVSPCPSPDSSKKSLTSPRKSPRKAANNKPRVQFSHVDVRRYERILSPNPACTRGPSVGIGWRFASEESVPLDEWEYGRRRIRSPSELMLSRSAREALIRSWGYSERDMAAAVRELNKLRAHRRQTVNNLGAQKMEEVVEAVCGKVKKLLLFKK